MQNRVNAYHAARRAAETRLMELAADGTMEAALPLVLRRFAPLIVKVAELAAAGEFENWARRGSNRVSLVEVGVVIAQHHLGNAIGFDLHPIEWRTGQRLDSRATAISDFLQALDDANVDFNPAKVTAWSDEDRNVFSPVLMAAVDKCSLYDNDAWLLRAIHMPGGLLCQRELTVMLDEMKAPPFRRSVQAWFLEQGCTSSTQSVYWALRHLEFACGSGVMQGEFVSPLG